MYLLDLAWYWFTLFLFAGMQVWLLLSVVVILLFVFCGIGNMKNTYPSLIAIPVLTFILLNAGYFSFVPPTPAPFTGTTIEVVPFEE